MALSYHGFRDTDDDSNNAPAVFTHDDTITAHPPAIRDLENSLTPLFSIPPDAQTVLQRRVTHNGARSGSSIDCSFKAFASPSLNACASRSRAVTRSPSCAA